MGFYSNLCTGCAFSIISPYVVANGGGPSWMYTVHLVEPKGREVAGVYDGYGKIVKVEYLREFSEKVQMNRDELRAWLKHTRGQGEGPQVTRLSVVMPALKSLLNAEDGNPATYGVKSDPKKNYASIGDFRHYACWKIAGEPGFEHGSPEAPDQGFFANWKGLKEPTTKAELAKLRKKAMNRV